MSTYVQGSLFEKGYFLRTLGAIAHEPDIALTELVANCWDAGAAAVHITVPDSIGGDLRVRDDGLGMLTDEFTKRWMKLGYDRQEQKGKSADFPPERAGWKRMAYGRNGVGRHGLLCFADDYQVSLRPLATPVATEVQVAADVPAGILVPSSPLAVPPTPSPPPVI